MPEEGVSHADTIPAISALFAVNAGLAALTLRACLTTLGLAGFHRPQPSLNIGKAAINVALYGIESGVDCLGNVEFHAVTFCVGAPMNLKWFVANAISMSILGSS